MAVNHVNWGIIGCGNVCERKSGPPMYKLGHSSLTAVMRNDKVKLEDFARRHNVPKTYTDASELIADPDINMIYIATPPNTHKRYALEALAAGKPIYVEKPMAMNYLECTEMIEAAGKAGQRLFVAYYRRALPYFLKIKELLDAGGIGEIVSADVKYIRPESEADKNPEKLPWRLKKEVGGEGYFYDLAPHTIDILDFLLGEISEAKGFGTNRSGLYEVPDTVAASFRFKSGVLGTGLWSFATGGQPRQDTIVITGRKGFIRFNTFSFEPIEVCTGNNKEYFAIEPPEHIQQPLIQTIIDELRGVGTCPSTGISAARTSKVMDMIFGNMPENIRM